VSPLQAALERGGKGCPFWIAGPCAVESRDTNQRIAETLKTSAERLGIPLVFKASFDKANRTSSGSFRGVGLEKGLEELLWVKRQFELPILTDVHDPSQVAAVAEVADILQIPAFLSRQTDLIEAACRTGRCVNVKKGQFMDPTAVKPLLAKLAGFGATGAWITERGVSFGYQRLVVDFAGFPEMERAGAHLIMDVTHAVQLPGAGGDVTGGIREAIPYLARAAAAVGVHGIFAETHPDPSQARSDAANAWPLDQMESLMASVKRIAECAHGK